MSVDAMSLGVGSGTAFSGAIMLIRSIIIALSAIGIVNTADAGQRTFVASHGLDTNSCTLSAPCRSFGTAIAQTATGGEVIVLDSAGYGPVTIGKSISLIAPAGVYAGVTVSSGDGIVINAAGSTVILRGLSINGLGGAIDVHAMQVASLHIENCVISGATSHGVLNEAPGSVLSVLDTVVRGNGGAGISVAANSAVVIDRTRVEKNGADGFFLATSTGEATATLTNSVFAYNGANGIAVNSNANAKVYVQVEGTSISSNGAHGFVAVTSAMTSDAQVSFARNAVNGNGGDGITLSGATGAILATLTVQLADNVMHANKGGGYRSVGHVSARASNNVVSGNGSYAFICDGANILRSYNNNVADSFFAAGGCHFTVAYF
ncbi:MAG: right-handed parallel beta-helix repeat-containing protein [Casimicrobiaceae bacterium]